MVKKSVKSRKKVAKTKPASKAKVSHKAKAKRSVTSKAKTKRRVTPKAKAKRSVTTKAKAKRRVAPKAKAKRSVTSKAKAKRRVTPKAKAKRSVTTKAKAKRRVTPKAKAKRSVTSKAKAKRSTTPKAKAKRSVTSKAKAKRRITPKAKTKRRVTPKAKAKWSVTPKAKTKRRVTPKAKAKWSVAPKAKAKRRVTPKAKATRKAVASKHPIAKKPAIRKVARKPVEKVAQRQSPITAKSEFDFNAFMLPSLALEQYEPNFEQESGVVDKVHGSTRYAWIGSGQCGGRLVKSFYELGYKKILAVNTTHHDLDLLDIPQSQKFLMDIGESGAGKDMERGKEAVQQYQQEILHLTRQTFGSKVDHIMVCFGAGGGTGSGSVVGLIEIAKRYARYIGINNPNKNVGVIMTLPTVGEASSPLVAENAYKVAWELSQMAAAGKISPLIIVDNDKINKMYPKMTVKSFWPTINNTVASLFDIFNRLSSFSSQYTSFDSVDYRSIMESGGCSIMGLTKVTKFSDKFAISEAVKKNLEKTLLASGFDLPTAKVAGCVAVGGRKLMANVKGLQDNIDYAFDVLSEITGKATIHRGVYEDGKNSLRVYTIIGGLEAPTERLEELRSHMAIEVR